MCAVCVHVMSFVCLLTPMFVVMIIMEISKAPICADVCVCFCFIFAQGLVLWTDLRKSLYMMRRVLKCEFVYDSLTVLR